MKSFELGDPVDGDERCERCVERQVVCQPRSDSSTCNACRLSKKHCSWAPIGGGRRRGRQDTAEDSGAEFRRLHDRIDALEEMLKILISRGDASDETPTDQEEDEDKKKKKIREGKKKGQ